MEAGTAVPLLLEHHELDIGAFLDAARVHNWFEERGNWKEKKQLQIDKWKKVHLRARPQGDPSEWGPDWKGVDSESEGIKD